MDGREDSKTHGTHTHAHRDVWYSNIHIDAAASLNLDKISVNRRQTFHGFYHKELCGRFLRTEVARHCTGALGISFYKYFSSTGL